MVGIFELILFYLNQIMLDLGRPISISTYIYFLDINSIADNYKSENNDF